MCQEKPGPRCHSHTSNQYRREVRALNQCEERLHRAATEVQGSKNTLNMLEQMHQDNEVTPEEYPLYRSRLEKKLSEAQEREKGARIQVEEQRQITANALHEMRATKTGLENLASLIEKEQDENKRRELTWAYNSAARLLKHRKDALAKSEAGKKRGMEMNAKAKEKMAEASALPEYDEATKAVKREAMLEAQKLSADAHIEYNGGRSTFPALFDKKGNVVPAKLVNGKYGPVWALLEEPGNPKSKYSGFITVPQTKDPQKIANLFAKKGISLGQVKAYAVSRIVEENGTKKVSILRNDGGYSPDVEILKQNIYKK